MPAFDSSKNVPAMSFPDIDGHPIDVRPLYDAGLGRNVVELAVKDVTVRLSNAMVPHFTDGVTIAAFLGEVENVARGASTPAEE